MFVKNKPKKLYALNILIYLAIFILYIIDSNILNTTYEKIIDVRVAKAIRDINFIAVFLQTAAFLLTLIRATGFDIKSFDFGKDLQELKIDVKDNEEFEVAVEFDQNKVKRNVRSSVRNFKYFYVEHKLIINLTILGVVALILITSLITKIIYTDNYKTNQIFSVDGVEFNITNAYLTKTDINNKTITPKDKTLVVVKMEIRKLGEEKKLLNTGLITLTAGGKSYSKTDSYNDYLTDIGTPYTNDDLQTEFTSYIITFEIPKKDKNIKLKINDNNSFIGGQIGVKNIYVKLKPIDLTGTKQTEENRIGDTISFSGSMLGETTFNITKYAISNKFKAEYQFCLNENNCKTSYEYITPTATGNYFKTLLKLNGNIEEDETVNLDNIDNIYNFLNEFATIYYQLDGKWHSHKINSELIKPTVAKDNYYYIEVNKEIEKAESIYLTLNVINYTYKYMLK